MTALAPPTLQALAYELASIKDWYSLGVNLGLKVHQLHVIERNYHKDITRCKTEMLDIWLHDTRYPSWEAIIDALCLRGKFTVALRIKREYCSSTTTVGMCLFVVAFTIIQVIKTFDVAKYL